jgi:chromosome segregation ATPase
MPARKEHKMEDGIQAQIASVEARCKSNSHRIDELEADNKALHQLATSVEVLATKQETIEENVNEIKADVKSLKALPASRWEAVVKGVITALIAGLIGFALAKLGVGG